MDGVTDFLLELRSEEIPARMQDKACDDLARLFGEEIAKAGLKAAEIVTYATPRRLALIAKGLPLATEAVSEERKGPRADAHEAALQGFLRSTGLTVEQLVSREDAKGAKVYFAVIEKPGRATAQVLAEAVPAIVRAFPWPKSMRWGAASASTESLRWVRPLQGIVALFGDDVVPFEIDGVESGSATLGHRFHHAGPVTIGNAGDYAAKLNACHVIVDQEERRAIIRAGAEKSAGGAGLVLVPDEGLVVENAGLTEWPVPMLGRFDPTFLAVPEEVIQLTARVNQKYFICRDSGGKLANAFVCTANITANDGGAAIVAGNEKVLAARLSDAKFFWDQDKKIRLEVHAEKLKDIVFHEKLGTVANKIKRVSKVAEWLVDAGVVKGCSVADAKRAAELCKADLVSGMVGEFPELQGTMGGYYARDEKDELRVRRYSDAVADAIRDHYQPVGPGDEVPTAPATVAVSLADKLDTLIGFFAIREKPTGSKDPYALRRAMLGIIEIIVRGQLRIGVRELVREAYRAFATELVERRWVLWQDFDDDDRRSPLLDRDAAYKDGSGELVVLSEEPPPSASDWDEHGKEEWNPWDLRRRGLVDFDVAGFTEATNDVTEFCFDRLRDRERRAGRRADLIEAVLPREIHDLGEPDLGISLITRLPNTRSNDDIVRIFALGNALQAFVTTDEGTNLLAGYKRAANILKQLPSPPSGGEGQRRGAAQGGGGRGTLADSPLSPGPSPPEGGEGGDVETSLRDALDAAEPKATAAIEAEDFEGAMAALASLRAPIDAFFDGVMVNDPDPKKRAFRLGLLARFRDAVHRVADFSKIEG